jgi:hypothetical protein
MSARSMDACNPLKTWDIQLEARFARAAGPTLAPLRSGEFRWARANMMPLGVVMRPTLHFAMTVIFFE